MIPYDVIVASASRPHLLAVTLRTLFANVDQLPTRVLLHDDAVWPGRQGEVNDVLRETVPAGVPFLLLRSDPPTGHGAGLWRLLNLCGRTEFLLYTQDDFETVRPIPVADALTLMKRWPYRTERQTVIHQIRFNKRATMATKDTWQGPWHKRPVPFGVYDNGRLSPDKTQWLTVADHWYFQTGLWRTSVAKGWASEARALDRATFDEKPEECWNRRIDQQMRDHHRLDPRDALDRMYWAGTYIWGPIGEDRYVRHIGDKPEDWAMKRDRTTEVAPS